MKRFALLVLIVSLMLASAGLAFAADISPNAHPPVCQTYGSATPQVRCTDAGRDIDFVSVAATPGIEYDVKYDQSTAVITVYPPIGFRGGSLTWRVTDRQGSSASGRFDWGCEPCAPQ